MIEQIYYWIGAIIFWAIVPLGLLAITLGTLGKLLDFLAVHFKTWWIIYDFLMHRKKFKEYLKNEIR